MTSWIKGDLADDEAALLAAARLLAPARIPAVAGLVADVDGIRAAIRLAEAIGGFVDPLAGPQIYAALGPFAAAGCMETTPNEAIARADLVLAFGAAAAGSPLLAMLATAPPTTGTGAGLLRGLVCIGGASSSETGIETVSLRPEGLAVSIGYLRAVASGRLAGDPAYVALANRLRAARFGVLLYEPDDLGPLAVEMLAGLAKDVSETTRCFALPLADDAQGRSIVQVSAWIAGRGPRTGFGRGVAEHDPWRFDRARAQAAGEVDGTLWLASLPQTEPPSPGSTSVALLGAPKGDEGDVVIGVAVPGEDAPGTLWDMRRGALVHHPASRPSDAPPAAAILARLGTEIARLRAAPC